ncbi:MAG TPA: FIST N-terminal domain-containing protein [Xanthobacteraceae bacterium]|nr:FIST N-terminal domain-containing protein [Xanthobacteraceae bacterium]
MRTEQLSWSKPTGWHNGSTSPLNGSTSPRNANLVLYFGAREALASGSRYHELRAMFPDAHIMGCSTGGQISNDDVTDDEIFAAALSFDHTPLRLASAPAPDAAHSHACGEAIGRALAADDLAGVFVLSDGLNINGSKLVAGITSIIGNDVPLTGGLAGDGARFEETLVGGDCPPKNHAVTAVGFYGSAIRIGHGTAGGWDEFGPRRSVTRSVGNVLYELDGEPALDLYERYLGEDEAKGLPGTGLLFPLLVRDPARPQTALVRTILAVDREARSLTFAGDVPQGWVAQLMRGNFDRLAAGSADAARQARAGLGGETTGDEVALLVSCIGRRLLMGQRTSDEVEAAGMELGAGMPRLGFYSYGEISPHATSGVCELHNQTMTVTTLAEVAG